MMKLLCHVESIYMCTPFNHITSINIYVLKLLQSEYLCGTEKDEVWPHLHNEIYESGRFSVPER